MITHAEFQLLTGLVVTVGFFALIGAVYFLDILTTKNK
jgi:hypothetical protein